MVCYGQDEMASQYFALGMQLPPAPQSPFSLYSVVNKLHSPDRTAFAFWAHMLLELSGEYRIVGAYKGSYAASSGEYRIAGSESARARAAPSGEYRIAGACKGSCCSHYSVVSTYPVVSYTQH